MNFLQFIQLEIEEKKKVKEILSDIFTIATRKRKNVLLFITITIANHIATIKVEISHSLVTN